MFNKLKLIWDEDASVKDQYMQFIEMLNLVQSMYHNVVNVLRTGKDIEKLKKDLYLTDIKVNQIERKIRKEIVAHLTLNPGIEMPSCLVLMSITKDAERLGDLCKNLYTSVVYWNKPCNKLYFCEQITEFENYVHNAFELTIKAFETENDVLASEIIQKEIKWNKRFDAFIKELSESELETKEAVCTTLFARTLKRLQAHLSNIASSIVLPVHHIDQNPEKLRY